MTGGSDGRWSLALQPVEGMAAFVFQQRDAKPGRDFPIEDDVGKAFQTNAPEDRTLVIMGKSRRRSLDGRDAVAEVGFEALSQMRTAGPRVW